MALFEGHRQFFFRMLPQAAETKQTNCGTIKINTSIMYRLPLFALSSAAPYFRHSYDRQFTENATTKQQQTKKTSSCAFYMR